MYDTQISIAAPPGTYGRVAPRSSLATGECHLAREFFFSLLTENDSPAAMFSIDTVAGVIDADHRGILYLLLFSLGDQDFEGSFPDHACDVLEPLTFFFFSERGRSHCPVGHRTYLHPRNFGG